MEQLGADGILIHMLLGKLKPGDIPAEVRDASIRKMVEVYFPPNTVRSSPARRSPKFSAITTSPWTTSARNGR